MRAVDDKRGVQPQPDKEPLEAFAVLLPAGPVVLRFGFGSQLHSSVGQGYPANRGFYRIPVNDSAGLPSWMAISELWAVEARTEFPCFDEPALKATFSMSLEVPASAPPGSMTTNMPLVGCATLPPADASGAGGGAIPSAATLLGGVVVLSSNSTY